MAGKVYTGDTDAVSNAKGAAVGRLGGRHRIPIEGRVEDYPDLFVQALGRGLAVLSLFDVAHADWTLDEISRRIGISKTATYRMLRTLEYRGFLLRDFDSERYRLGPAMIPATFVTMSYLGFTRRFRPILERLSDETGETVELAVGGGGGAVIVERVSGLVPIRADLPLGMVYRTLANSAVKVFVAFLPMLDRRIILSRAHPQLTPNTETAPERIDQQLDEVVRRGFALDLEEQDVGVCAVSAPVFSTQGAVRAVMAGAADMTEPLGEMVP